VAPLLDALKVLYRYVSETPPFIYVGGTLTAVQGTRVERDGICPVTRAMERLVFVGVFHWRYKGSCFDRLVLRSFPVAHWFLGIGPSRITWMRLGRVGADSKASNALLK
jgi:hypothetical protein